MTPETIASLINLGAAGAVIIVVWRFLSFIEKRDKQWQDYFTDLHKGDDEKTDKMADILDNLVKLVQEHDTTTKEAIALMVERTRNRGNPTQPRPKA